MTLLLWLFVKHPKVEGAGKKQIKIRTMNSTKIGSTISGVDIEILHSIPISDFLFGRLQEIT